MMLRACVRVVAGRGTLTESWREARGYIQSGRGYGVARGNPGATGITAYPGPSADTAPGGGTYDILTSKHFNPGIDPGTRGRFTLLPMFGPI
jgi:hypothetical protein